MNADPLTVAVIIKVTVALSLEILLPVRLAVLASTAGVVIKAS